MDESLATITDEQLDAAIAAKTQQVDFGKLPKDPSQWSDDDLEAGILAHKQVNQQKLNAARKQVEDEASAGQAVTGEGTLRYLGRQFVSPIRGPIINAVFGYSTDRFNRGEFDEGDLRNIALFEREQRVNQQQSGAAKLAGAAASVPGEVATMAINKPLMAAKFLAGGIAGSAAEQGKSPFDPEVIGHGAANAAVQFGVMSALGPVADKIFPTASKQLVGRLGAHGVTLPATQAAADATTYLMGLNSRYGTIQQFVEGHTGEGFLELASQMMLGAGFAAASRGPEAGKRYADTLVQALNEAKSKGVSPKRAIEQATAAAEKAIAQTPKPAETTAQTPSQPAESPRQPQIDPVSGQPVDRPGVSGERPGDPGAKTAENAPPGERQLARTPEQGYFDAPEPLTPAQRSARAAQGLERLKEHVRSVDERRVERANLSKPDQNGTHRITDAKGNDIGFIMAIRGEGKPTQVEFFPNEGVSLTKAQQLGLLKDFKRQNPDLAQTGIEELRTGGATAGRKRIKPGSVEKPPEPADVFSRLPDQQVTELAQTMKRMGFNVDMRSDVGALREKLRSIPSAIAFAETLAAGQAKPVVEPQKATTYETAEDAPPAKPPPLTPLEANAAAQWKSLSPEAKARSLQKQADRGADLHPNDLKLLKEHEPPKPAEPIAAAELRRRYLEGEQVDVEQAFDAFGLSAQQKRVMKARLENVDQGEIGKKMGITKQRVEQIERAAMQKMGVSKSAAELRAEQKAAQAVERLAQGELVEPFDPPDRPAANKAAVKAQAKEDAATRNLDTILADIEKEIRDAGGEITAERRAEIWARAIGESQVASGRAPPSEQEVGRLLEVTGPERRDFAELKGRAERIIELDREAVDRRNALIDQAFEALKHHGVERINFDQVRRRGGDAANLKLRGFDEVAETMAKQYPDLMGDGESTHWGDRLFELLSEGKQKPIDRKDAFEQAKREADSRVNPEGDLTDASGNILFAGFPIPSKYIDAMTRWVFGHKPGKDPKFKLDADPNPDNPRSLPAYDIAKRAAYNQLGARGHTRPEVATTAHAWSRHVGEQLGNEWALAHSHLDKAFPVDSKSGLLANGRGMEETIKGELAKPGSQGLTPDQLQAVAVYRGVWEKQLRAMEAAGVKKFRDDQGNEKDVATVLQEGYFPRTALPGTTLVGGAWKEITSGGAKPGMNPSYRKGRAYDTEAAGVADGIKYVPSFAERVANFIRDTNREIADHRLASDPLLGGKDVVTPYFKKLLVENKPVLDALPKAERDLLVKHLRGLASQAATGNVYVAPAFRGKEYTPEVKRHIESMYGERAGPYLKLASAASQELRNAVLGPDASYATLQLQPMLFSNPIRWARTMARVPGAFWRGDTLANLVQSKPEFRQAVQEITQAGGSIGTLPEQVSSLSNRQSLLSRVPVIGPMYERFGRAFSTAMDVAKIELWRANKPKDQAQWPRAIEAIENSLGQGRMETLGMTPERAFLERLFFLAPSYYRAHAKLLQQAGQSGAPGRYAMKQLGFLASGVLTSSIGALYAMRMTGQISQEELEERLSPSRGKFLTIPVPLGTSGKTVEIGFGGVYMSIARLVGNYMKPGATALGPASQWYRGHAGPLPRLAWDLATGTDYFGEPVTPKEAIAKSVLPLAVQQAFMGDGTVEQRATQAGVGLTGLRAFPGSDRGNQLEKLRKFAEAKHGVPYSDLSLPEQAVLVRDLKRTGGMPSVDKPSSSSVGRAIAAGEDRRKALTDMLSKDSKEKLAGVEKQIPTYDTSLSLGGIDVPLSEARLERYAQLLAEEYDRTIATWPLDKIKRSSPESRESFMRSSLTDAKGRARGRLIRESNQRRRQPAA